MTKISINRDALLYHLDVVSKALSAKSELYSGIRIELLNGMVELAATNGEIYITSVIPDVKIECDDNLKMVLVKGKLLVEIIKKLEERYVEFVITDKVLIKSGKSKFTLNVMDVSKFPDHDTEYCSICVKMPGLDFKNLIKKTIIAVSTSETKQALTGINFKTKNQELYACATDVFRVAKDSISINSDAEINVIVPASSLNELIKIMRDDAVVIMLNNKFAMFSFGTTDFQTRLINSPFPDLDNIFPSTFVTNKVINRLCLISALERASIMFDSSSQIVKIDFKDNQTSISTIFNELGQAYETIETKGSSDNIVIVLSYKYLVDALKTFNAEEVELNISGELRPMVINDFSNKETIKHLILPIKLDQ